MEPLVQPQGHTVRLKLDFLLHCSKNTCLGGTQLCDYTGKATGTHRYAHLCSWCNFVHLFPCPFSGPVPEFATPVLHTCLCHVQQCPASSRGAWMDRQQLHRGKHFVIEIQQQHKPAISNDTFNAVKSKSMNQETTGTKARRWSIRGLKGFILPLAAVITEGGKMNQ